MNDDKELLEMAAKAAGIEIRRSRLEDPMHVDMLVNGSARNQFQISGPWNPLTDDGDALRLAVVLRLPMTVFTVLREPGHDDPYAATRRAIVRAAASIGSKS